MDISSTLKSEILRPITTVVVPGSLAVGPYVPVVGYYVPVVRTFWNDHPTAFSTIIALCVLAAGLVLEDFGSLLESKVWDPILEKRYPKADETWNAYLQLELKDEIIGQRYIRTIVARLKFELAMAPALLVMTAGVGWMNAIWAFWRWWGFVAFAAVMTGLAGYLSWESFNSTLLLTKRRPVIVEAGRERAARRRESGD
jgi:hypothetical protein